MKIHSPSGNELKWHTLPDDLSPHFEAQAAVENASYFA